MKPRTQLLVFFSALLLFCAGASGYVSHVEGEETVATPGGSLIWRSELEMTRDNDAWSVSWAQSKRESMLAASADGEVPGGARSVQLDMSVAGAQNTFGFTRRGYRVYLTLTLSKNGRVCQASETEITLEGASVRKRPFSIRCGADGADAFRVEWRVEAINGAIGGGELAWQDTALRLQ